MSKYIRGFGAPLALSIALALSACTVSEKSKSDSALATDTALNKDLQLAGRDTASQPALKDVPTTPPAAAPAPTPPPMRTTTPSRPKTTTAAKPTTPAPTPTTTTTASGNTVTKNPAGTNAGGAVGTIASGTSLSLRSGERVCTNTNHVGQTFSATLANSVSGSNGATIPAGATVTLEVTTLKRSENANDKIVMEFAVKSVNFGGHSYPVSATVADAQVDRVKGPSKDAQKVAIGAGIGAIAGQILGKSTKGTLIGAAAGAAAGAGVAAGTANYDGCVPDGGNITVTLNSPLQVRISS